MGYSGAGGNWLMKKTRSKKSRHMWNGPNGILWGWGKLIYEKNQKQKISSHSTYTVKYWCVQKNVRKFIMWAI